MTEDQNRHRRHQASIAMKRLAIQRKCPKCHRKMAIKKTGPGPDGYVERSCRYCDYSKGYYVLLPGEK
jgi:hypothetical protein